ncbi:secreted protein [Melampsora americana]|nr:secreted protein [Melampsora americana]
MSSTRFLLSLFTFLVTICMFVSTAVIPVNSNQEAITRLRAEVERVNEISTRLASQNLHKSEIATLAQDGIDSELVQNSDRLWLAEHQIKNSRSSNSMGIYDEILHRINTIITLFKEMLKSEMTVDRAHQTVARIAQVRALAKPLNRKLMENAGYTGQ